ncbi:hypothetical protein [uncultured Bacteroides sp.]|jgi:hypothetical protein|uniref:hypothetical protein n=1 Tax=uncultured Bacteroides sp. TaxID=162156 RepID=UPI002583A01A|nr:hypothetical protein [uncultured Bacteroides sp.]
MMPEFVIPLIQNYSIMYYNKTTTTNRISQLFLFISVLFISGFLITGCHDDDDVPEQEPPIPDYTIIVKDIQNIPEDFVFDRVEVKVTGVDWSVIETLTFPYENGQIIMDLPTVFSSEVLQKVDRRGGDMSGYWTGTSNDGDALVATLGDFFVFNADKKVGRIAISNWTGRGSSAGKATLVSYQFADRPFSLTGSDKSYNYSDCSFVRGWNMFANINPASENGTGKVLRTTVVPESTLFWRLAESYVYN